jgi:hypothetical protein
VLCKAAEPVSKGGGAAGVDSPPDSDCAVRAEEEAAVVAAMAEALWGLCGGRGAGASGARGAKNERPGAGRGAL